jgi:biotin carboxyl carrier protein
MMEFEFQIEGKVHKVSVDFEKDSYRVNLGGKTYEVNAQEISNHCFSLIIQGEGGTPNPASPMALSATLQTPHSSTVYHAEKDGRIHLSIGGEKFLLEESESKEEKKSAVKTLDAVEKKTLISATMPGKVVKLEVSPGDMVEKNQTLVILEAMKMENDIRSPINGKVVKVYVSENDQVNSGDNLVELTPNTSD